MYCVRYKSNECGVGYIRPWNAVRDGGADGGTYSLTYLIPSFINGIEKEMGCNGKILRHKLRFNGMTEELFVSPQIMKKSKKHRDTGISKIHQLCNPEIILGFESEEDAINASKNTIYVGQTQYMIYPVSFSNEDNEDDDVIVELTDEEFSKLSGTETFQTDENNGVYCGNNRYKNNERMYIKIVRVK